MYLTNEGKKKMCFEISERNTFLMHLLYIYKDLHLNLPYSIQI